MKNSFALLSFRLGFLLAILFITALIVYLVQIEFDIIHGVTRFLIGVVKTIFVLLLLNFSFYGLTFFSKKLIKQEQETAS